MTQQPWLFCKKSILLSAPYCHNGKTYPSKQPKSRGELLKVKVTERSNGKTELTITAPAVKADGIQVVTQDRFLSSKMTYPPGRVGVTRR